ncbi:hypothetical protein JYT74_00105 [Crocinitomix catalasitica]|nr:hypothetical protein [Crocinitomix catalasitica]
MRAELNNLENIDLYLSGKMSAVQKGAFEAQMAADPALKSIVQDQQLLIQTVNRKALIAEINTVAGIATAAAGTAWGLSQILWTVTGSIVVVGTIGTAIYYGVNSQDNGELTTNEPPVEEFAPAFDEDPDDFATINYTEVETTLTAEDEEALAAIDEMSEESNGSAIIRVNHNSDDNRNSASSVDDEANDSGNSGAPPDSENKAGTVDDPTDATGTASADVANKQGNNSNQSNKSNKASNSSKRSSEYDKKTFSNAYLNARYPGGDLKRSKWTKKNLRYPETPKRKGLEAIVKVRFFVDENGAKTYIEADLIRMNRNDELEEPFSGAKLLGNSRSVRYFEREATRIVRIMPGWEPATDRFGNPVTSEVTLHVKFDIDEGCFVYQLDQ